MLESITEPERIVSSWRGNFSDGQVLSILQSRTYPGLTTRSLL